MQKRNCRSKPTVHFRHQHDVNDHKQFSSNTHETILKVRCVPFFLNKKFKKYLQIIPYMYLHNFTNITQSY